MYPDITVKNTQVSIFWQSLVVRRGRLIRAQEKKGWGQGALPAKLLVPANACAAGDVFALALHPCSSFSRHGGPFYWHLTISQVSLAHLTPFPVGSHSAGEKRGPSLFLSRPLAEQMNSPRPPLCAQGKWKEKLQGRFRVLLVWSV